MAQVTCGRTKKKAPTAATVSTDKMWWEEIVKWLNRSDNNKLVIYYKGYNDELDRKLPVNTIRLNNRLKREILEKGRADVKIPNEGVKFSVSMGKNLL